MMRFKLFGINFFVSYWAILFLSYGVITSGKGQPLILVCLISSLLHEIGHLFFIFKYSRCPSAIRVYPYEIKMECTIKNISVKQDVMITSAGIIVNFLLSIVLYVLYIVFGFSIFLQIALCNLSIGLFNLLPIASTDGGQLLNILLSQFLGGRALALISGLVTCVVLFFISLLGVYVLFISRYNFSLLFIGIYFLIIFINKELR